MKRKILLLAMLILASAIPAAAQQSTYGDITASASTCAGNFNSSACVRLPMPANQATVSVTVLGTFTATLAVERSANHGGSWVSAGGNITATGTSTYAVAGYTDFRVRASAYTSGSAKITITSSSAASGSISSGSGAPSGSCGVEDLYVDTATGSLYDCLVGVWTIISGGSGAFSGITAGTNIAALLIGNSGTLDTTGTGTINANKIGGRTITITTPAANDALVDNGSGYVNSVVGLPSRADNDGTVVIATTDRNKVVNVGHATANAVSIAQAGVAAANGFDNDFQFILCTRGTGLTTLTPTTSTINTYTTLTQRQNECARIHVPTEADTNYLATIDGGPYIEINVELFAPATATATGDGKAYFYVGPKLNGMTLINMYSQVYTAGATNTTSIGLDRCIAAATSNVCSSTVADMLSVNQTIDSAENSSDTAATGVTINAANALLTTGQVLRFNVDAISTTPANGLQVTLRFRK